MLCLNLDSTQREGGCFLLVAVDTLQQGCSGNPHRWVWMTLRKVRAVDQTVEFVPLLGTERTSAWPPHFTKFAEKSNIWRLLFQIKSELNAFKRYFRKRTHSKKIKLKNCAAEPAVYWLRGREQNNWEIQPMTVLAYRVKWRKSRYKYCTLISALS